MKYVIDGQAYDSDASELIAHSWEHGNGVHALYITPGGALFECCTPHEDRLRGRGPTCSPRRLTPSESVNWLLSRNHIAALEKYFPETITEATGVEGLSVPLPLNLGTNIRHGAVVTKFLDLESIGRFIGLASVFLCFPIAVILACKNLYSNGAQIAAVIVALLGIPCSAMLNWLRNGFQRRAFEPGLVQNARDVILAIEYFNAVLAITKHNIAAYQLGEKIPLATLRSSCDELAELVTRCRSNASRVGDRIRLASVRCLTDDYQALLSSGVAMIQLEDEMDSELKETVERLGSILRALRRM